MMRKEDLLNNLEIPPFSQIIWNTSEAKDEWANIIYSAMSVHDRAEYWMVKEGARKCATLHISPHNYDHTIEKILKDGLVWLPIQRTKNYNGFSHRHFPVEQLSMESSVYGVLARNITDAEDFRDASRIQGGSDHRVIADLLGFPPCCGDFFSTEWPSFIDPMPQYVFHSDYEQINDRTFKIVPHIYTQQMLRYSGFRVTSHFPCKINCEESISVGEKWIEVMNKYDPVGTKNLLKVLSLPGKWSVKFGIVIVETEPFTIVTNSMPTKDEWIIYWDKVQV